MRLGQLARKLSVRTSDLVEFLAARNIQIETDSNTRIEDEHVALIMNAYGQQQEEPVVEEPSAEVTQPEEPVTAEPESTPEAIPAESSEAENQPEVPVEVIRAPKVSLSGLKVIGKIDVPERKRKTEEELAKEAEEREAEQRRREEKAREQRKKQLARQREREARAEKKRREEALKDQKEKRKQHYLEKTKTKQPARQKNRPIEVLDEPVAAQTPQAPPRSFVGKFLKWLRRE